MFTGETRERTRAALVSAAHADPDISGAAHLGSAAVSHLDAWSDVDLALCVSPQAQMNEVLASWTERLYRVHEAVTHFDVHRGEILYRVFLLRNTLQVDLSFWPANEFRAVGPKFKLIFGTANGPRISPGVSASELVGMAWLYALHVRSSIARSRFLQAEYMLSGMKSQTIALACLRHGLNAVQGRGFDDLPDDQKQEFIKCCPSSLSAAELQRAFQITMRRLLAEIRDADETLATKIEPTLAAIAQLGNLSSPGEPG